MVSEIARTGATFASPTHAVNAREASTRRTHEDIVGARIFSMSTTSSVVMARRKVDRSVDTPTIVALFARLISCDSRALGLKPRSGCRACVHQSYTPSIKLALQDGGPRRGATSDAAVAVGTRQCQHVRSPRGVAGLSWGGDGIETPACRPSSLPVSLS